MSAVGVDGVGATGVTVAPASLLCCVGVAAGVATLDWSLAVMLGAACAIDGGVAVTVMSNYGFHQAMKENGVEVAVTSVGDRYVLEALRDRNWALGGEQSGHIISTDYAPTGDGIAAALMLLEALGGCDLAASRVMEKLPQKLVNVEVADRDAIAGAEPVWTEVDRLNAELEGEGRVLLRPSGTEPLVRVMAEAPSQERAEQICESLAGLVRAELG